MAGTHLRMVRGPFRSADRRGRRRRLRRLRLDAQFLRDFTLAVVFGCRPCWHRRRCSLWHLCRKRAQVVSRSARPSGRLDCCRFRRGRSRHRYPDPRNDPRLWLRSGFSVGRAWAGPRHCVVVAVITRAAVGRNAEACDTADAFTTRSHLSKYYGHRCSGCSISCS